MSVQPDIPEDESSVIAARSIALALEISTLRELDRMGAKILRLALASEGGG